MKITMIGSGCWEGTPAPFCKCRICTIASKESLSIENRTRPEFLVEHNETKFLIEISPDIRTQSTKFDLEPITDYVVSHWHFDHLFGLYELHAWIELVVKKPINIFCSQAAADMINGQFGFIPTNVKVLKAYQKFKIGEVEIMPFPVFHMRRVDDGKLAHELDNTFGYIIEADGRKVAYLADYYGVPDEALEYLKDCQIVLADGTYLFEDVYPKKPYQLATLEEDDPDHLHGQAIIDFAQSLGVDKIVYHSITHLPEKTHDELQALLPKGQYIGFDGYAVE